MPNETEAARAELDQLARTQGAPVPNPVQSLQPSGAYVADLMSQP